MDPNTNDDADGAREENSNEDDERADPLGLSPVEATMRAADATASDAVNAATDDLGATGANYDPSGLEPRVRFCLERADGLSEALAWAREAACDLEERPGVRSVSVRVAGRRAPEPGDEERWARPWAVVSGFFNSETGAAMFLASSIKRNNAGGGSR